ncbi:hypothetical protein DAEQUDRAFT_812171 [Daedalea quercina L-15889]|uniref:Uncharacterized protein n=1 Tax=Daedalea quercina L-15889 TaxID=1314783 RepID=A0A165PM46_9APHY|nr:hypothetical protein DAEQUDRAFT_812171 [Daedalea quercina L-15889]
MSTRLLLDPRKKHELADDLESFMHVLHRMCLRFVERSLMGMPVTLKNWVHAIFDVQDVRHEDGHDELVGGSPRHSHMRSDHDIVHITNPNTPLGELSLDTLTAICHRHYLAVEPPTVATSDDNSRSDAKHLAVSSGQVASKPGARPWQTPCSAVTPAESLSDRHLAILAAFANAVLEQTTQWESLRKTHD